MAGSMKDMIYTADDGNLYVTRKDESAGEAFGFKDYTGVEAITARLPMSGFKMRRVNWQSNDGTMQRVFEVGVANFPQAINGGNYSVFTVEGNALVEKEGYLTSFKGEERRLPLAVDTGLTDGDVT